MDWRPSASAGAPPVACGWGAVLLCKLRCVPLLAVAVLLLRGVVSALMRCGCGALTFDVVCCGLWLIHVHWRGAPAVACSHCGVLA